MHGGYFLYKNVWSALAECCRTVWVFLFFLWKCGIRELLHRYTQAVYLSVTIKGEQMCSASHNWWKCGSNLHKCKNEIIHTIHSFDKAVTGLTLSRGAHHSTQVKKFSFWNQHLFSALQMCSPGGHDHANCFNGAINMRCVRFRFISFTCQSLEGTQRVKL